MKFKILILCAAILYSCNPTERNKPDYQNVNLEDSIKQELNFDDSIKIIKTEYDADSMHFYVFINFNKNSKFHSQLKEFYSKRNFDSVNYAESYYSQTFQNRNNIKVSLPERLKQRWIPLFKFKGEFFVFQNCRPDTWFEINDSSLIDLGGFDTANAIIKYDKFPNYERITTYAKDLIKFYLVDSLNLIYKIDRPSPFGAHPAEQMVYNYEKYRYCGYFTKYENIKNFQIIVQHCHVKREDLVEFEEAVCDLSF